MSGTTRRLGTILAFAPCSLVVLVWAPMAHLQVRSPQELAIELGDGQRFALHLIWLHERCQDPRSMDLRTGQRRVLSRPAHDPRYVAAES